MTVPSQPFPGPTAAPKRPTRAGLIAVGAVLTALAALNLVPMLLAVLIDTSTPLGLRLANLGLFGVPTVLVLAAGLGMVRSGAGHGGLPVSPTTTLGRWAVGMLGGTFASMAVFTIVAVTGHAEGEAFFDSLWAAVPLLVAGACAVTGLAIGAVAILARRERSSLVLLTVGVGLFAALFALGETLAGH